MTICGNILTRSSERDWDFKVRDPSELPSKFSFGEETSLPPKGAKRAFSSTGFACNRSGFLRVACQRPKQRYGRAMVTGNDLAIHRGPCSCASDGQGALVALVH